MFPFLPCRPSTHGTHSHRWSLPYGPPTTPTRPFGREGDHGTPRQRLLVTRSTRVGPGVSCGPSRESPPLTHILPGTSLHPRLNLFRPRLLSLYRPTTLAGHRWHPLPTVRPDSGSRAPLLRRRFDGVHSSLNLLLTRRPGKGRRKETTDGRVGPGSYGSYPVGGGVRSGLPPTRPRPFPAPRPTP